MNSMHNWAGVDLAAKLEAKVETQLEVLPQTKQEAELGPKLEPIQGPN